MIGALDHDNRRRPNASRTLRPALATPSSSRAWARAASLPGCPESMRDSSVTRSSPTTGVATVTVRPRDSPLTTLICASALEATCARCVTTSTWRSAATSCSASPSASAAAPPTPASTSSKTIVGGPPSSTSLMANIARASSPPEAARANGWTRSPTLAPRNSSTGSPAPSDDTRTSRRAPAIARSPRCSSTCRPKSPAASRPHRTHGRRGLGQLRLRLRSPGRQPRRLPLRVLQHGQPRRRLRRVRHHRGQVLAVLAPQLAQQPPALLDLGEPGRVVFPSFDRVAERTRHVGQLDRRARHPRPQLLERLAASQRRRCGTQLLEHAAFVACRVEHLRRRPRGLAVRRRIRQPLFLRPEAGLLVGILQAGDLDLAHLIPDDVGLPGALLLVTAQGLERAVDLSELRLQRAQRSEVRAGKRVEHVALRPRGHQRAVLVLPVDLDQLRRRLGQCTDRRHPSVDPRLGAPLRRHGAGQDDFALVSPSVSSPSGPLLGHHEARLHQRLDGTRPHHAGVGPPAEHELQRLHHERLAGTGLPGQRRHAGTERQRQVLDHAEVSHA